MQRDGREVVKKVGFRLPKNETKTPTTNLKDQDGNNHRANILTKLNTRGKTKAKYRDFNKIKNKAIIMVKAQDTKGMIILNNFNLHPRIIQDLIGPPTNNNHTTNNKSHNMNILNNFNLHPRIIPGRIGPHTIIIVTNKKTINSLNDNNFNKSHMVINHNMKRKETSCIMI
jgi:hypothetical protein